MRNLLVYIVIVSVIFACKAKTENDVTPWGETLGQDTLTSNDDAFSLEDIVNAGEMIMLTISSPETYYDYHGRGLGLQYLVCERFAQKLGVMLRVEVCADSAEVMQKLEAGEGDIAVFSDFKNWHVAKGNDALSNELKAWYTPDMLAKVQQEQKSILANGTVKRRVYPFMLSRATGTISRFDNLFRKYAPTARMDWTLLAAQCYQESCFDPMAHSWAGACGLMQIMPSTATQLGLPHSDLYDPEQNIKAAVRYMADLIGKFNDVPARKERLCFALASYNGGIHHVRDAMALARSNGKDPHRWADVRNYILALQSPQYYRDPVVKNGYMRGSETVDYVDRIMDRWRQYGGATHGKGYAPAVTPTPSKKKNRWDKGN